jgi:hypothetical protein
MGIVIGAFRPVPGLSHGSAHGRQPLGCKSGSSVRAFWWDPNLARSLRRQILSFVHSMKSHALQRIEERFWAFLVSGCSFVVSGCLLVVSGRSFQLDKSKRAIVLEFAQWQKEQHDCSNHERIPTTRYPNIAQIRLKDPP